MNVLIAGATGYLGNELVKILVKHRKIKIKYLCGNSSVGKKIVDFDPTFIASIFSASTASLGFQIKKKKDTIVDNKNNKVGIK